MCCHLAARSTPSHRLRASDTFLYTDITQGPEASAFCSVVPIRDCRALALEGSILWHWLGLSLLEWLEVSMLEPTRADSSTTRARIEPVATGKFHKQPSMTQSTYPRGAPSDMSLKWRAGLSFLNVVIRAACDNSERSPEQNRITNENKPTHRSQNVTETPPTGERTTEINFITINDTSPASKFLAGSVPPSPYVAIGLLRIDRIESGFRTHPAAVCVCVRRVATRAPVCACPCARTQPRGRRGSGSGSERGSGCAGEAGRGQAGRSGQRGRVASAERRRTLPPRRPHHNTTTYHDSVYNNENYDPYPPTTILNIGSTMIEQKPTKTEIPNSTNESENREPRITTLTPRNKVDVEFDLIHQTESKSRDRDKNEEENIDALRQAIRLTVRPS
ncbi:unnamed protein product [Danaus chrysippus]|uniref:(African queen) hypothetical protein n=1 Tax=Danaus chrysippus TaxID=151541 RepID=A0A8J2QLH6_9NEOP|nr:unnamed protein product [Danaus chrysippus]